MDTGDQGKKAADKETITPDRSVNMGNPSFHNLLANFLNPQSYGMPS